MTGRTAGPASDQPALFPADPVYTAQEAVELLGVKVAPELGSSRERAAFRSRHRGTLANIMVVQHKHRNALSAINAVLVMSRAFAYEGDCAAVVSILDVAEYLPLLMLDAADRTDEFRAQLVGLARQHPRLVLALERFDAP